MKKREARWGEERRCELMEKRKKKSGILPKKKGSIAIVVARQTT